jgi:hypothetical protein
MLRMLAVAGVFFLCGCVERIVTVRSEPAGATVFFDDKEVGVTPCDIPYIWYGKRELALERDGYRPVRDIVILNAPWWQIFPCDLVTDVLIPFTIRDRMEVAYLLEPMPKDVRAEVLRRAAELREKVEPKEP